ncbi:hypothetical protein scyTo_0026922, partial [Scyliorhinus torazame]|nr:hypothetical protein [Scyliorhinus torazame]
PPVGLAELTLDSEETWCVACSDGEVEDAEGWCPDPQEIRCMYEILAEQGTLELSVRPLPRRPPTPEVDPQEEEEEEEEEEAEAEADEK